MIDIAIRGTPAPQSRPLVTKTGKVISDRSQALRKWKSAVSRASRGKTLPDGALAISIIIGMPVKDKKRWGKPHCTQPDFDNLAKSIVDAMQSTKKDPDQPIGNDGRIASAWVIKVYAPEGFCRVIIEPVQTLQDVCQSVARSIDLISFLDKNKP